MVEIEEITPKELEIYTTKLVPRLLRLPPYHWTRIDSIAKNVGRFIDICQCLADHGFFNDPAGWLILDIYKDTFVRLNPKYINFINDNANKIPNKRPTRS
ncbi:hypothetical protein [Alistipes sp.]|uniref:hypothetical protein n=1 Tax=Alistipes sp. TaxID=1872444 RepID=UPI003AB621DE